MPSILQGSEVLIVEIKRVAAKLEVDKNQEHYDSSVTRVKSHSCLSVLKADDTMLEERNSANKVKAYAKMFRKPNVTKKTILPELQINHMEKYRNESSIANLDVDLFPFLPVNPQRSSKPRFEHAVERS